MKPFLFRISLSHLTEYPGRTLLGILGIALGTAVYLSISLAADSSLRSFQAGVTAVAVVWAKELARHGIRAASIAPGFTRTELLAGMPEAAGRASLGCGNPTALARLQHLGAGNPLRELQPLVHDQRAAREIEQPRARFHFAQPRGVDDVFGFCGEREQQQYVIGLGEHLVGALRAEHHLDVLEKNRMITSVGEHYGKVFFISQELELNWADFEEIWNKLPSR